VFLPILGDSLLSSIEVPPDYVPDVMRELTTSLDLYSVGGGVAEAGGIQVEFRGHLTYFGLELSMVSPNMRQICDTVRDNQATKRKSPEIGADTDEAYKFDDDTIRGIQ